jgi:hypothetical protein
MKSELILSAAWLGARRTSSHPGFIAIHFVASRIE